jgi:hypothetical protein
MQEGRHPSVWAYLGFVMSILECSNEHQTYF